MRVEICRPSELGQTEIELWHLFQKQDARLGNPFLSPEFAICVDGSRPDVRLAVIVEDRAIVGFLPFSEIGGPFSSLGGRFARPAAPGFSDLQAVVHRSDHPIDLVEVITRAGLIGWFFDHLLSYQVPVGQPVSLGRSWVVDLTGCTAPSGDNTKSERPHKMGEYDRKWRRLQREHGPVELRLATGPDPVLARLFELKRAQCRREGWRDVLAEPWIARVVRELADTRGDALVGIVSALLAGDEIVSVEFGIRSVDVYASWIHAYDSRYSRYSPGSLLWSRLFPRLAQGGVRCIDLGKGFTEAKRRFSTGSFDIAEGFAVRRGVMGGGALAVLELGGFARGRATIVEATARQAVRTVRRRRYRRGGQPVPDAANFHMAGVQP